MSLIECVRALPCPDERWRYVENLREGRLMWATESEDATETGKDRPHRPDRRKLEVKGRKPYVLIHQSAPNQTKLAELQLFFFLLSPSSLSLWPNSWSTSQVEAWHIPVGGVVKTWCHNGTATYVEKCCVIVGHSPDTWRQRCNWGPYPSCCLCDKTFDIHKESDWSNQSRRDLRWPTVTYPRSWQLHPPHLTGSQTLVPSHRHSGCSLCVPSGQTVDRPTDWDKLQTETEDKRIIFSYLLSSHLKNSMFQVHDVDFVVSCTDDQAVVLKQKTRTGGQESFWLCPTEKPRLKSKKHEWGGGGKIVFKRFGTGTDSLWFGPPWSWFLESPNSTCENRKTSFVFRKKERKKERQNKTQLFNLTCSRVFSSIEHWRSEDKHRLDVISESN